MVIQSLYISHCYAVQFPPLESGLISEYSDQWKWLKESYVDLNLNFKETVMSTFILFSGNPQPSYKV